MPLPRQGPLRSAHHTDPAARLAEARERRPVSQPHAGGHFVTRPDDVRDVLTDRAAYSSVDDSSLGGGARTADPPVVTITVLEPPDRTAVRARLRRWFVPVRLRGQEPRIGEMVTDIAMNDYHRKPPSGLVLTRRPARLDAVL